MTKEIGHIILMLCIFVGTIILFVGSIYTTCLVAVSMQTVKVSVIMLLLLVLVAIFTAAISLLSWASSEIYDTITGLKQEKR